MNHLNLVIPCSHDEVHPHMIKTGSHNLICKGASHRYVGPGHFPESALIQAATRYRNAVDMSSKEECEEAARDVITAFLQALENEKYKVNDSVRSYPE